VEPEKEAEKQENRIGFLFIQKIDDGFLAVSFFKSNLSNLKIRK
jgi:hypothetical protein